MFEVHMWRGGNPVWADAAKLFFLPPKNRSFLEQRRLVGATRSGHPCSEVVSPSHLSLITELISCHGLATEALPAHGEAMHGKFGHWFC